MRARKLPILRIVALLGLAVCLLALFVHPGASSHAAQAAAFVLVPVLFFRLIDVPRSLWPAAELEMAWERPVVGRAKLFQRPPPFLEN